MDEASTVPGCGKPRWPEGGAYGDGKGKDEAAAGEATAILPAGGMRRRQRFSRREGGRRARAASRENVPIGPVDSLISSHGPAHHYFSLLAPGSRV